MNTLHIDTSSNQEIKVGIRTNGKKDFITQKIGKQKAQVVLPLVQEILTKRALTKKDLDAIEVVEGPGSFTGLRVGIAVANALSYSLGIPVNGKKHGEFVVPIYE